jgi:hypothetical protein
LGDTFLRSAYVVYDLTNDRVAMAQSLMNATRSNVVEIPRNGTVPLMMGQEEVQPTGVPKRKNGAATERGLGGLTSLMVIGALVAGVL